MARPKSEINKLKVFQVNIRLTTEEQVFVENQANSYGISVVTYVRKRALNKQMPKHSLSPINRELLIELSRIGNNVNQLAKKSNQNFLDKYVFNRELKELKHMLNSIKAKLLEMIAKQIKGKDFYGVLCYNQKKIDKGEGSILDSNLASDKVVMQTKEFNIIRQLRPNLSKAVYHTSLSLPYTDSLSDNEFTNLAREYLEGMGFDDNQYIIYKHTDQDHAHIHIVANRVKFSGEVVSDSQDYKRSEAIVRKLELKYNLTQLNPKKESNVLSRGEIEKCLRTGEAPERLELQQIINELIKYTISIVDFEKKLKEKKVSLKFNTSKEGKILGISFEYKGITYKGSKVQREFSWNKLKLKIYEQDRGYTALYEANRRVGKTQQKTDTAIRENGQSNQNIGGKSENNLEQNTGKKVEKRPRFRRGR